jgi:hypothetical protein
VLASILVMVGAAHGPWEQFESNPASGFDRAGRAMYEAGAVAAIGLLFHTRRVAILMAIGGLMGIALCLYERMAIKDFERVGIVQVDVGWSLYLALLASLSLIAGAVTLHAEARRVRDQRHTRPQQALNEHR